MAKWFKSSKISIAIIVAVLNATNSKKARRRWITGLPNSLACCSYGASVTEKT